MTGYLTEALFTEAAARFGWKMTPQRKAIVDFMVMSHTHPTAEDVFDHVNSEFPMTSRATIYNTLHLLRDHDLITEISVSGIIRFDPRLTSHYHIICETCGSVRDVPDGMLMLSIHPSYDGIQITNLECVIRCMCERCRFISPVLRSVAL